MTPLRAILIVLSLLYPVAIYFGLQHFDARFLVLLLVALAGLRMITDKHATVSHWLWIPLLSVLVVWVLLSNSDTGLKLYPVLINLSFLILFAWSLRHPPTVVERMARLSDPDLPDYAKPYVRRVTQVWCGFFLANGSIALATALCASEAIWALYNGLIAYLLMGLLFGGEWLVRQRVIRAAHD